ncbi:MAG: EF-hand domain-containing protein [Shimia sp.]
MTRTIPAISIAALCAGLATSASANVDERVIFCDTAFTPADANADGLLSDDEIREMRISEYDNLDANKDGSISREEYVNCTVQQGETAARDAMAMAADEAMFDALDTDGDDSVSFGDWAAAGLTAYRTTIEGDLDGSFDSPFIALSEDERMGTGADGTDDQAEAAPQMDEDEYASRIARYFANLDRDRDGQMTREEFMNRLEPRVVDSTEILNRFEDADTDGSGDISQEEFSAMSEPLSSDEAAEILEELQARTGDTSAEAGEMGEGMPVVFYRYIYIR